jgi:hypothetical protein
LIADENSAHEREADLSADALLSGNPLHAINRFGSPAIQRKAGSPSAPKPGAAGGCGLCYKNEQEDGKVQPFQLQIGRDAHTQVQEAFVISYPNIVSLHEQGVRADEPTGKSKKGKSTTSVDEKLFGTVGFPDLFMISTSPLDVAVDAPTEGYTPVYFYGEIKPDNPQGIKDGSDKLQKYKEILVTNKKYNAKPLVPRPD